MKPESCRIVYKEASGFHLARGSKKQYKHAVATPSIPQNQSAVLLTIPIQYMLYWYIPS